jgi:hypothetical protein
VRKGSAYWLRRRLVVLLSASLLAMRLVKWRFMHSYELASDGIQIVGEDSYHVVKVLDKDEWLLLRKRKGSYYQAAAFSSGDEARAFAHSCGLVVSKL